MPTEMTPDSGGPELWASAFALEWTDFSVDIAFGKRFEGGKLEGARGTVSMSPQLALALGIELQRMNAQAQAASSAALKESQAQAASSAALTDPPDLS